MKRWEWSKDRVAASRVGVLGGLLLKAKELWENSWSEQREGGDAPHTIQLGNETHSGEKSEGAPHHPAWKRTVEKSQRRPHPHYPTVHCSSELYCAVYNSKYTAQSNFSRAVYHPTPPTLFKERKMLIWATFYANLYSFSYAHGSGQIVHGIFILSRVQCCPY